MRNFCIPNFSKQLSVLFSVAAVSVLPVGVLVSLGASPALAFTNAEVDRIMTQELRLKIVGCGVPGVTRIQFGTLERCTLDISGEKRYIFDNQTRRLVDTNPTATATPTPTPAPTQTSTTPPANSNNRGNQANSNNQGNQGNSSGQLSTGDAIGLAILGGLLGANVPSSQTTFQQQGVLDMSDLVDSSGGYYDQYNFSGNAGQTKVITVESADFDTHVFIYDTNGNQIAENDDFGGGTNSRVTVNLPATGRYFVDVTSYPPGSQGRYLVTIQ